jgi:hypothetical protein
MALLGIFDAAARPDLCLVFVNAQRVRSAVFAEVDLATVSIGIAAK